MDIDVTIAVQSNRPSNQPSLPSVDEIRSRAVSVLCKRPCTWQINICRALLDGSQDVISIAGTGMGKTLTFWLPLLFRPEGVQIIVTPLNILGQQNIDTLEKAGVRGIFISAKNATKRNFEDIAALKYRAVVVNPEELMRAEGGFQSLFKNQLFANSVISIIIDEAHCISQWGSFRPEYRHIGSLRHLQRKPCPIMATSATLTTAATNDIKKSLCFHDEKLFLSRCSVDRPNISIVVQPMVNPRNSFLDLQFLLRGWKPGDAPPPKFLVFFDSIPESVQAGLYLRSLLPPEYRDCIKWFNSEMSDRFKAQESMKLLNGDVWGFMATDSFGMGMDLPDILIIVQWGATCSVSTLWQRFGRCVRNPELEGIAILITEKEHLDSERAKKAENAEKRRARSQLKKQDVKRQKAVDGTSIKKESDEPSDEEDTAKDERRPKKPTATHKAPKRTIDAVVDDLINAEQRGYACRRIPIMDAFKNDEALFLHLECDVDAPGGCKRCGPKPHSLCCDLHNPEAFAHLRVSVTKPSRQAARSAIPEYASSTTDNSLRLALETWRCEEMKKKYGWAHLRNLGPGLVMGTSVRDRIVDCAHFSKIRTIEDLERETKWDGSTEFGSSIIAIIAEYFPLPAESLSSAANVPSESHSLLSTSGVPLPLSEASRARRRAPQCSVCGVVGHTMRSSTCRAKQGKENIAPSLTMPLASSSTSSQNVPQYASQYSQSNYLFDQPLVFQSKTLQELYDDIIQRRS